MRHPHLSIINRNYRKFQQKKKFMRTMNLVGNLENEEKYWKIFLRGKKIQHSKRLNLLEKKCEEKYK